ncbi:RNA-directed DNA polymerase, eukaryota, nucleotide-binding alpha-beta plait domain protein [Tanacetum coccineum]|uniref:RNA-directed DNA polymerase, eukaryota, nucleotide-binding alpha-beta plait domain protein n=1 Tax=Tanacetum coccineum TaxID=301880 RepID=A0ABQ5EZ67_9ASTR
MGDFKWKSQQSFEDQTSRVSKSVYVTNFLESSTAKDLWKVCNDYGTAVDVFIPFKKSKACKHFAFVRFIKVHNLERLIDNLCTIWIGKFHLHANMVRFQRPHKPTAFTPNGSNLGNSKGSFASVLKEGNVSPAPSDISKPDLILDDSCIKEFEFSLSLMGKVKNVSAILNLYIILANEGFQNLKITYLGGLWVLLEMDSIAAKEKFLNHTGVGSWFSNIKQASKSFECDEQIVWVAFCLLEDLTVFCLKISLRFASRPHCVFLQDIHCVLLEDLTAFLVPDIHTKGLKIKAKLVKTDAENEEYLMGPLEPI